MRFRAVITALAVSPILAVVAALPTAAAASAPAAAAPATASCTVCAWGSDSAGQLGFPTASGHKLAASPVPGVTGLVGVAAGGEHSLAVRRDGTVWAWGNNDSGRLGDGTTKKRTSAVQARGLSNVVAVAAGSYHSLALDRSGFVWGWGVNSDGQVGDGTDRNSRSIPVRTHLLTNVKAISAGGDFSMALRTDGTVWSWGGGTQGELGLGNAVVYTDVPMRVKGLANIVSISAGVSHALAVRADGTVFAWGSNAQQELGVSSIPESDVPVRVPGIAGARAAATGAHHSVVLKTDGTVWAWGFNLDGELGDGTTQGRAIPRRVHNLSGVTSIAAGAYHSLALRSDGTVWSWGWNVSGQLGDGTLTTRTLPVRAHRLWNTRVLGQGSSAYHGLAISGAP